ncbi:hypothetical protein RJ639_007097 [Escallonia herrerae]|uniref:endo-polygalacturonase n=1 Tax=Escallonia herrerae TaxID=1293975 RepID=A0AA88VWT5_9ASTE|nr:hypothetical protein RJ639_007097 [Escallonia herrerae]
METFLHDPATDLCTIFLVICCVSTLACSTPVYSHGSDSSGNIFDVMKYGATGDGETDDSQEFLKAWEEVCGATASSPILIIPAKRTFLLSPVSSRGPCKSPSINVQISGDIVAPSKSAWTDKDQTKWIHFTNVKGLEVSGNGSIDGQGSSWWKSCENSLDFIPCYFDGVRISHNFYIATNTFGQRLWHSLNVTKTQWIETSKQPKKPPLSRWVTGLHMVAPETSPNTDGIDISNSKHVTIQDSQIATGDDCIAINGGSSYINITRVTCGPGRGISVGSLGINGETSEVEEVHVRNCTFKGTQNGARIKTWQGGSGYARKISFVDIILFAAKNPILIDQFYCDHKHCENKTSAVKISEVSYARFQGTSSCSEAIKLQCSKSIGCTGIVLNNNTIESANPQENTCSICINAHGTFTATFPTDHLTIFLVLCMVVVVSSALGATKDLVSSASYAFSVISYGAIGDGTTNDSQAFMKAWKAACEAQSLASTVLIPAKTFLLKPVTFSGPCTPSRVYVQPHYTLKIQDEMLKRFSSSCTRPSKYSAGDINGVELKTMNRVSGNIIAPNKKSEWDGSHINSWLSFSDINNLIINGRGQIDGQGSIWWQQPCIQNVASALTFNRCNGLRLNGLTHINSPRSHITITHCNGAVISNLCIVAPETSPNTDGIDISGSTSVQVRNSYIGTGDDCIAISGGSSDINISRVTCGPGHGISIGALGHGGYDTVEDIHVKNCTFKETLNGVRLKTWQGGSGYARKVSFEKIKFAAVNNPIIIDQFYCPSHVNCQNQTSAVKLSDISFSGIMGTSATDEVINLSCSQTVGCTNIAVDHVYITSTTQGRRTYASCFNAHGKFSHSSPADHFTFFLVLCMVFRLATSVTNNNLVSSSSFNAMDFGAVGDGTSDDSQAFLKAWKAACKAQSNASSLVIPRNRTFLLKPATFSGPCTPSRIYFLLSGNLVAPNRKSAWAGFHINSWLTFANVNGLTIYGRGQVDGQGSAWWPQPCLHNATNAMIFNRCNGLRLSGSTHINSPRSHIILTKCHGVIISNLHIIAPETSPNTDGIDISGSTNVQVRNSYIGTGDDCVAISGGSSNVNITGVTCGPGHGISIGALGHGGYDTVEDILVRNCTLKGTMTGVRIKSWQGGEGYARKISFEKIKFVAVNNPIIIDQYYCPSRVNCQNKTSAIKLSDISYRGILGTSTTDEVINLSCSESVGCTNIVLDHVYITSTIPGKKAYTNCINAYGRSTHTKPTVKCLLA